MSCLFCQIIAGEIPAEKIYEDEKIVAFLDINPVNPGHALVVPRQHSENLLDADAEDLSALARVLPRIAKAVISAVSAEGFNVGVNNGSAAGQIIPHLHFHIMPRFSGDGLKLWRGQPYAEGEMQTVAQKIRTYLK